jgi:hypothetical protein
LLVKPTPTMGAPPTVIPGVPKAPVVFPVVCIPPIWVEPIVEPIGEPVGLLEPIEPNVLPKLLDGEEPVVEFVPLLPLVESDDPLEESPVVEAYIPDDGVVGLFALGEEVGDDDPKGEEDEPKGEEDDEDPKDDEEDPKDDDEDPNPPEVPLLPAIPVPMPGVVPELMPEVMPVC